LPNFALDRLSRYEATLWRQVGRRILFALDALDRRKSRTTTTSFGNDSAEVRLEYGFANYRAGASSLADDF
jgi:hypothetical protein